jgi:hypothetical protein
MTGAGEQGSYVVTWLSNDGVLIARHQMYGVNRRDATMAARLVAAICQFGGWCVETLSAPAPAAATGGRDQVADIVDMVDDYRLDDALRECLRATGRFDRLGGGAGNAR